MKNLIKIVSLTGILAISLNAYSSPTNSEGLPATKEDVHTNTTNISINASGISANEVRITANDIRISAIEDGDSGTGVDTDVNCVDNPLALKNTTLTPGTTYVLTGMCDGPVRISEPAGTYSFRGDATGIKDDGIISPPGQVEDYVFSAYGPISASFHNLTISGANYTSLGGVYVTTVYVTGNSSLSLNEVDVVGGDNGVNADSAYIAIGDGVNITGFREEGLIALNGGNIRVDDFISVTGAANELGDFSVAMDATRNGSIVISGGGIFTAGTDDGSNPDYESISMSANGNGTIRIRNSNAVTLTGAIEAIRSSEIRIQSGGTIVGAISATDQSHVRVRNVTHSGGNITAISGSGFTARNSTLSDNSSDWIGVQQVSTMSLRDTTVGNSSGAASINVFHHGFLSLQGAATDLNGRIINCSDPVQDIQLFGATGIGTNSCI